jgi:hypothetical protein
MISGPAFAFLFTIVVLFLLFCSVFSCFICKFLRDFIWLLDGVGNI